MRRAWTWVVAGTLFGCGGSSAGPLDAGSSVDAAATLDAGSADAGSIDAGSADAGPLPSWSLDDPDPGEWPTFKRSSSRTGLVAPSVMHGAIDAANVCVRWPFDATVANTRANSGVLLGRIAGRPTVFAAVESCPNGTERCTDAAGVEHTGGFVYAIDGATGAQIWRTELPEGAQVDVYAPLLADVDADGRRELVVGTNIRPLVFALRTEDEPGGVAGSIQWTFRYDDVMPMGRSEGTPVAAQMDDDPALEVVIGSDSNEPDVPARMFVIDGATGAADGTPFVNGDRRLTDPACPAGNKIDSSSPAVASVDGEARILVGSWDGHFYALALRGGALVPAWDYPLPRFFGDPPYDLPFSVGKVRGGAVVADLIPGGDLEVAFGFMGEASPDVFDAANVRVLSLRTGALVGEVAVADWKSSPSVGDLVPGGGLEITGGRYRGYYAAGWDGTGFRTDAPSGWLADWGDGRPYGANRSSPALGDLDGDGDLEVVVGTEGEILSGPGRRGLTVLDGATGALAWTWPPDGTTDRFGVSASPALGDIDGDGALEVVFFATDGRVYALDSSCP